MIRGDVRDRELMINAIQDMDYIIPLAAIVGFPMCKQDETAARTINLDAIKMLIEIRKPEQRIIYP